MILKLPEKYAEQLAKNQFLAIQTALQLLWRAWRYASDTKTDPWQFAVELTEFRHAGVAKGELRWLVAHRYAVPAVEVTGPAHLRRQFSKLHNGLLPENSCFILSEAGLARLFIQPEKLQRATTTQITIHGLDNRQSIAEAQQFSHVAAKPYWNQALKSLQIGEQTVKQFRIPAPNQELIIKAFQECAWQSRIDDPLPSVAEQDPKRRLNDTIRCLNRHQNHELLRFRGDGTGTGVLWEARTPGQL